MVNRILILICLIISPWVLLAQTESIQQVKDTNKEGSLLQLELEYTSDAIFMGRKDSIAAPYLMPGLSYYHKSGFFANATLSYLLSADQNRIDLVLLGAGYLLDFDDWSAGLMVSKYFYDQESYSVLTEVEAAIAGMINYDMDFVETTLLVSSYLNSSDDPDFFTDLSVGAPFYFNDRNVLVTPTVSVQAGSQNFYEAYYQSSRLGNRKGKSNPNNTSSASSTIIIENAKNFEFLAIEVSVPIYVTLGKFVLSTSPAYVIPQNPSTITINGEAEDEQLENSFYINLSVGYFIDFRPNKKV
ncbi:MAG: hypothetical protein DWP94_08755 [Flavobacterium sp.]|nr:MAG: hypothetical protein DWP94_08755 [Flavobacterium sp.]